MRINEGEIIEWASRYIIYEDEINLQKELKSITKGGYLTRSILLKTCKWKSPRTEPHCKKNDDSFVKSVTGASLSTKNEQLRIEVLTLLQGVGWPTASAILHLCFPKSYPILDFRALWSLSMEMPKSYKFEFWWEYTQLCRKISKDVNVSLRQLDRALWQFSKENQK